MCEQRVGLEMSLADIFLDTKKKVLVTQSSLLLH